MITENILWIIITLLGVWLVKLWWRYRSFFQLAAKIPQIEGGLPLLGYAHKFIGANNKELLDVVKHATRPGPSPRKTWLGHLLLVVIDDPDQLQKVFNSSSCLDKPAFYKGFDLEKGLLVANGALWKNHRKLLEPAFSSKILKSFMPIFNEKSKTFIDVLSKHENGNEFNIFDTFTALSFDNILTTSTGVDKKIQTHGNEFLDDFFVAHQLFALKALKIWLQFKPIFRFTKDFVLHKKHVVNGIFRIADEIISEKDESFTGSSELDQPQIFIDQLFKKRDVFSFAEMRDEILTVIAAGFETTSTSMSYMVLLMAIYPHLQDKIVAELEEVFETADEDVTDEKLNKLIYLEMTIKETMRFWPPAPFFARYVSQDMEIGSVVVPAGANIGIPVMQMNKNKKIWGQDADQFNPDRFSVENYLKVHPYAYLPFARGPRKCIGFRYAMISMKVSLAHFFRNYKVSTAQNINEMEFEYAIVMKPLNGCRISIVKRAFGKT